MHDVSETAAWGDQAHAKVFDYLSKMPKCLVKKHYESFNEGRLLKKFQDDIKGKTFFEIGCATGELYRYINIFMKQFDYYGFDISEPGIKRAKEKYPQGQFNLITAGFEGIVSEYEKPDVVWCRDVVLHQENPYAFIDELIDLSDNIIILRVRTRDVGETETDSKISCQLHWDKIWVPYIILNTDEMIEKIKSHEDVNKIIVSRSYEVLGGHNSRYLPKDLYYSEAGTAETAVFIQKGKRSTDNNVEVQFDDSPDRVKYNYFDRAIHKAALLLK